jgi:hypothetical protein
MDQRSQTLPEVPMLFNRFLMFCGAALLVYAVLAALAIAATPALATPAPAPAPKVVKSVRVSSPKRVVHLHTLRKAS